MGVVVSTHRIMSILLALVLGIAAVVCAGADEEPGEAEAAIELSLAPAEGAAFEFGRVVDAVFTVKNTSDKAIVVESVVPVANTAEETIGLYGGVYGSVAKLETEDAYGYSRVAQQMTGVAFHAGLLLPGQAVEVVCRYRPIAETESFRLVYVAARGEGDDPLSPLKVYIEEVDPWGSMPSVVRKYVPFNEAQWKKTCAVTKRIGTVGPSATSRGVIIPELPKEHDEIVVEIEPTYAGEAFLLEDATDVAAEIADAEADVITLVYCGTLGGYVVFEKDAAWMLTSKKQEKRGERLAVCPRILFKDVDCTDEVLVRVGYKQEGLEPDVREAPWKLWDTYQVYYGDGMYTRGEFIHLKKKQALGFLREAHERGCTLGIHYYFFRSRYYTLEGQEEGGAQ